MDPVEMPSDAGTDAVPQRHVEAAGARRIAPPGPTRTGRCPVLAGTELPFCARLAARYADFEASSAARP